MPLLCILFGVLIKMLRSLQNFTRSDFPLGPKTFTPPSVSGCLGEYVALKFLAEGSRREAAEGEKAAAEGRAEAARAQMRSRLRLRVGSGMRRNGLRRIRLFIGGPTRPSVFDCQFPKPPFLIH